MAETDRCLSVREVLGIERLCQQARSGSRADMPFGHDRSVSGLWRDITKVEIVI